MTRCDMQGVPKLVQKVKYDFGGFWFWFTLLDGSQEKIDAGYVRNMSITTREPTNEQFGEAESIYMRFRAQGI